MASLIRRLTIVSSLAALGVVGAAGAAGAGPQDLCVYVNDQQIYCIDVGN